MAPDSGGEVETVEDAVKVALKIGYPVALKAAAGLTTGASGEDLKVKTQSGDMQIYFGIGAQF